MILCLYTNKHMEILQKKSFLIAKVNNATIMFFSKKLLEIIQKKISKK